MNSLMKKVIPFMLAFVLCLTHLGGVSAMSDLSNNTTAITLTKEQFIERIENIPQELRDEFPALESCIKNALEVAENQDDVKTIEKKILDSKEFKHLRRIAGKVDKRSAKILELEENLSQENAEKVKKYMKTEEYKQEEKEINQLAKELYDYYQKHSKFPNQSLDDSTLTPMSEYVVSSSQGVGALSQLGYTVSQYTLAQLLASLGVICGLGTAVSVGSFVAVCAGIVIGTAAAIIYHDNIVDFCGEVASTISQGLADIIYVNINNAKQIAAQNNMPGVHHWVAYLSNNTGLGGITLGSYLSFSSAVTWLGQNNMYDNVWSFMPTDAYAVALGCSIITSPVLDSAHTQNGTKPMNKAHYHATTFFVRQAGHSFFF